MNLDLFDIPEYAIELVTRRHINSPVIHGPQAVAEIATNYLRKADREHFIVIMLSTKHQVIGIHTAHIGSINASIVRPADVFKVAILSNAAAIIVAHNHPSGNKEPSREDVVVSKRLAEAGKALELQVLDSLIVTVDEGYTSLAEKGLM
jgi:DNA repair protein RadC